MSTTKKSAGVLLLQISLAIIFLVNGIRTVFYSSNQLKDLFGNGDLGNILNIVIGVIEMIAGVILLIQLFAPLGVSLNNLLMLIIMILCIAIIVVFDVLGDGGLLGGKVFKNRNNFFTFLENFSAHLLMLGAVIVVRN